MKLKTVIVLLVASAGLPLSMVHAQVSAGAEVQAEVTAEATTETAAPASADTQVVAATPADVKAGAIVVDPTGSEVGKIESVDANGAVIATGTSRVQIPVASFAKSAKGLVISATKAQLDATAKQAS